MSAAEQHASGEKHGTPGAWSDEQVDSELDRIAGEKDALPPGAWHHTCMRPGDEAFCRGCQERAAAEEPDYEALYEEAGGDIARYADLIERRLLRASTSTGGDDRG